jgi:hypothetical protein
MATRESSLHRRNLLQLATAGAALGLVPATARARSAAPALVAGEKFTADGRVAPFAGNTVVCHVPQQGPDAACFEAMLEGYRQAPVEAGLRKVAMLPPSSYHMTVFSGANDRTRQKGDWPAYVPADASMRDCDVAVADRVARLRLGIDLPIRMKVDPVQGPLVGDALQIKLLPLDASEAAKLATARAAFAAAYDLKASRPEPYRFHISMGYALEKLSAAEAEEAQKVVVKWAELVSRRSPYIAFGAPEFCSFEDMFHFRRWMYVT